MNKSAPLAALRHHVSGAIERGESQPIAGIPSNCADCGASFPSLPAGHTGASGYAVLPDGRRICYACADTRQRAELKDRSVPFCAYLSGDGRAITTWTGGRLMDVVRSAPCALTRQSFTHDARSYRSVRARDVHGALWHGRGSPGICIKLRPMKG